MNLTREVWRACAQGGSVVKFVIDLQTQEIYFFEFTMPHFVFAAKNILKEDGPAEEICIKMRDRIIGGFIQRSSTEFKCFIGFSSIENFLDPANARHSAQALQQATTLCIERLGSVPFIRPLAFYQYGKQAQIAWLPLAA